MKKLEKLSLLESCTVSYLMLTKPSDSLDGFGITSKNKKFILSYSSFPSIFVVQEALPIGRD